MVKQEENLLTDLIFREPLCDVEKNDKDASKPVASGHFNLPITPFLY